jgi:hypothetical protein
LATDSETATWQFACLPSSPQYWCDTPTDLARYTHRIAISNRRLIALDDSHVAFSWRDYAHGSAKKVMRLSAHEFLRRFLLHVLPDGFQRIRHYGFLANGHRRAKLAAIRRLLAVSAPPLSTATTADDEPATSEPGAYSQPCPAVAAP